MYRMILVPLEGTPQDQDVLGYVQFLAKKMSASVVLLQWYRVMNVNDPFMARIQIEEGSAGFLAKRRAADHLELSKRSLEKTGIKVSTEFLWVYRPAAEAINDYALDKGCDLIVVAKHAPRGLKKWLTPGFDEELTRHSSVPVLVVGGTERIAYPTPDSQPEKIVEKKYACA